MLPNFLECRQKIAKKKISKSKKEVSGAIRVFFQFCRVFAFLIFVSQNNLPYPAAMK